MVMLVFSEKTIETFHQHAWIIIPLLMLIIFGNDSQVSDVAHEPQVLSTIYNSHYLINLVPKLRIL